MMTNTDSELQKTPLKKLFWKYTLPTVAAMIVNGLYTITDGVFIGRCIGADGLAAINVVWTLYGLSLGIGIMLGVAASALFSIEKGKQEIRQARLYLGNGILMLAAGSLLSSLFFAFAADPLVMFQVPGEDHILKLTREYFSVFTRFSFCPVFASAMPLFVRNDEHPKLATKMMIAGAILNIVGDYVCIYHFGMEMTGVAAATAFSQFVVTVWGFYHFFASKTGTRLGLKDFIPFLHLWRKISALGVSSLITALYYSVLGVAYNYFFAKYGSPKTVAAFSVVGYVSYIYYLFSEGMTSGIQPILSYNHGAQRPYNIRKALSKTGWFLFKLYLGFIVSIYLFQNQLATFFCGNDQELVQETLVGLRIYLLTCFLEGFILMGISYFQAVDDSRKAATLSVANMFFQLPFLFIFARLFGVVGIWAVYPVANIPLACFVAFTLRKNIRASVAALVSRRKNRPTVREQKL